MCLMLSRSSTGAGRWVRNTGSALAPERQHVPGAIVFLVRPGLLVLPDDVLLVVVDVDAADHADLEAAVHVSS